VVLFWHSCLARINNLMNCSWTGDLRDLCTAFLTQRVLTGPENICCLDIMELFCFKRICRQQNKPCYSCATFHFWGGLLRVKDLTSGWAVCNPCHQRSAVDHLSLFQDREASFWKTEIPPMKISRYQQARRDFYHRP